MTRDKIVRGLRSLADEWGEEGLLGDMTAMEFVTAVADLLEADKTLAGEPGEGGERSAERAAFVAGASWALMSNHAGDEWVEKEALRHYPEKPQEGKP